MAKDKSGVTWFWVDVSYACFGIELTDGVVTDAAPIARWMMGMESKKVYRWIKEKNGKAKRVQ